MHPLIQLQLVQPEDTDTQLCIAEWYLREWNIPVTKTLDRLQVITAEQEQFQIILTIHGVPIATGGLYKHVGLLDKVSRFNVHNHWLALVYTVPERRQQGYGALLCNRIVEQAKIVGIQEICLYTDTAESLYSRLGWVVVEQVKYGDRKVTVMCRRL